MTYCLKIGSTLVQVMICAYFDKCTLRNKLKWNLIKIQQFSLQKCITSVKIVHFVHDSMCLVRVCFGEIRNIVAFIIPKSKLYQMNRNKCQNLCSSKILSMQTDLDSRNWLTLLWRKNGYMIRTWVEKRDCAWFGIDKICAFWPMIFFSNDDSLKRDYFNARLPRVSQGNTIGI